MSSENHTFASGEPLTADPYGPLACFQVGQDQCVVDLRNMRRLSRFRADAWGVTFTALLVSKWRQWFGLEAAAAGDEYKVRLRSVSVDSGDTIFLSKSLPFTWSLVQISGTDTVGVIHEKHGLMEFDRNTGEVVGERQECRDYDCIDPDGVALVRKSPLNAWIEHRGVQVQLDMRGLRKFLDAERHRMPVSLDRPGWCTTLGSKRAIGLHHPIVARSVVLVHTERSIVGFSIETGELVFTMSPQRVYQLAYHPERDTLIAMGWSDLDAASGSRVLMEIDIDTRHVLWSQPISCVSTDRRKDPGGFLCDHGRFVLLPNRRVLAVGSDCIHETILEAW